MDLSKNKTVSTFLGVIATATSYALLGRLSLMLAIPPGYATAIFPPAGIALAVVLIWGYRLWPGVFLGSLLLNTGVSLEQGSPAALEFEFAFAAATGASLQALAGAWMIHRFVGFPSALSKEQEIVKFMVLAGPIACLINASIGVASLYITGIISSSDFSYSLFTSESFQQYRLQYWQYQSPLQSL